MPRKYLEFRLFWPYSSGIPDQWMVHQIDTVHWFTGLPHPRSVVANGGIYLWKDGRKNWDTMTAVFDYGPLDDLDQGLPGRLQLAHDELGRRTSRSSTTPTAARSNLDTATVTPDGGLHRSATRRRWR